MIWLMNDLCAIEMPVAYKLQWAAHVETVRPVFQYCASILKKWYDGMQSVVQRGTWVHDNASPTWTHWILLFNFCNKDYLWWVEISAAHLGHIYCDELCARARFTGHQIPPVTICTYLKNCRRFKYMIFGQENRRDVEWATARDL